MKKIKLFQATKQKLKNIKKIYRTLLTITPTPMGAERMFFAMGVFATKIKSGLSDDTLNAMMFIRQFYRNQV